MQTIEQCIGLKSKRYGYAGCISESTVTVKEALEAIKADRAGKFADSPKLDKTVNINIASLGTFNINGSGITEHAKAHIVETLLKALNDAATKI